MLRDCTLTLKVGERLAIVGDNGSGKSTLLKVAAGLLKPLAGQVRFAYTEAPALLLQNPRQQLITNSVQEEIIFTLRARGLDSGEVGSACDTLLHRFGLEELRIRKPLTLSGGQQQRLALAALLAREPELVLLDEPESFLDGKSRAEFREFFFQHVSSASVLWTCCRDTEVPPGFRALRLENGSLVVMESKQVHV
ncbi:MAG: ABC transporter ATP-binding protein [Calditrichaeota bacterium]|nr:ABC transporter ATP-binding protein [Calditrichota bacterium]